MMSPRGQFLTIKFNSVMESPFDRVMGLLMVERLLWKAVMRNDLEVEIATLIHKADKLLKRKANSNVSPRID